MSKVLYFQLRYTGLVSCLRMVKNLQTTKDKTESILNKAINHKAPQYVCNLLSIKQPSRALRSRIQRFCLCFADLPVKVRHFDQLESLNMVLIHICFGHLFLLNKSCSIYLYIKSKLILLYPLLLLVVLK